MEIQIAVAKIDKFGATESGDTLEVVERPNGGVSVVLADGKLEGKSSKAISNMVAHKVTSLLAEGIRDGAAARAASDHLFTAQNGASYAHLAILSADFQTNTLVNVRNHNSPVYIANFDRIECIPEGGSPIGLTRNVRPVITEISLATGMTVVLYTDGLNHAGSHYEQSIDVRMMIEALLEEQEPASQDIADAILAEAIRLDQGRPNDDMSVVVLRVLASAQDPIRRMSVRLPVIETIEHAL